MSSEGFKARLPTLRSDMPCVALPWVSAVSAHLNGTSEYQWGMHIMPKAQLQAMFISVRTRHIFFSSLPQASHTMDT